MREVKFRAWDASSKEMMYNFCYLSAGNIFHHFINVDTSRIIANVMQYTGLKDRLGMQIYEGDLLLDYLGDISEAVIFEEGRFKTKSWKPSEFRKLQVIGNIYEHPELMEDNHDME